MQLVYIGKFPHAGVRRAIRRIQPMEPVFGYIPFVGKATVAAHGSSFMR